MSFYEQNQILFYTTFIYSSSSDFSHFISLKATEQHVWNLLEFKYADVWTAQLFYILIQKSYRIH